jgi:hypothetical protein
VCGAQSLSDTVALPNIEPLGSIIVGKTPHIALQSPAACRTEFGPKSFIVQQGYGGMSSVLRWHSCFPCASLFAPVISSHVLNALACALSRLLLCIGQGMLAESLDGTKYGSLLAVKALPRLADDSSGALHTFPEAIV